MHVTAPTFRSSVSSIAAFLLAALVLTGCRPGDMAAPDGAATPDAAEASLGAMDRRLRELTRAVALSLADEAVRRSVHEAMHSSPYQEKKLEFRTLFESPAMGLLDGAARATGSTPAELHDLLDQLMPLEFYMPIDEHRATWDAGSELLVASTLDVDGPIIHAFDLEGQEAVVLPDTPPPTPTLALVPVETDFSRPPRPTGDRPALSGGANGVVMTSSTIYDDYEGALGGDPEFEVHVFVQDTTTGDWEDVSCAGEGKSAPYYFNQVELYTWSGEVLLISEAAVSGNKAHFQVWEDDSARCGDAGGQPPKTDSGTLSDMEDLSLPANVNDWTWWQVGLKAAGDVVVAALSGTNDEFVGVMAWPPVECWPEATGSVYTEIKGLNGVEVGYAALDNTFDSRTPLCVLETTISGPSYIEYCPEWFIPDPEANFTAGVSGSSGTPTFEWYFGDDVETGASSGYTIPNEELTYDDHVLSVVVRRGGEMAMDSKGVTVAPGACNW